MVDLGLVFKVYGKKLGLQYLLQLVCNVPKYILEANHKLFVLLLLVYYC